jgi:flagellar protein FlaF
VDDALHYNQKLWTVLQADLGSPLSTAPDDLRINLLRLSRYIDRTTFECLLKPELSKLEMLARINECLAEGLLVPVAGENAASTTPVTTEGVNWSL